METLEEKTKRILDRMMEHLHKFQETYQNDWFVIALQGSQNYHMDDEHSDIDTKVLAIPNMEDLIFNKKPISHTLIMENEEHVDCKDIRLYFNTFRKQNINFVEILFSDYVIVNPKYAYYWNILIENNEKLAHMNPLAAIKCMCGMCHEKSKDLTREFPTKKELIDKYGYDSKQLCHILRIQDFLERYIAGEKYEDCLIPKDVNKLHAIKRYEADIDLKAARMMASKAVAHMDIMVHDYEQNHSAMEFDAEANMLLDNCLRAVMNTYFYTIFGGE